MKEKIRFWNSEGTEMFFSGGYERKLWKKLRKLLERGVRCNYCHKKRLMLTGFERKEYTLVIDWLCKRCGKPNHGEYDRLPMRPDRFVPIKGANDEKTKS